jgi:copper chaperone
VSHSSTYTVTGMTCEHCVASVTEEVEELTGVERVEVVLETGELTIESTRPLDESDVKDAVETAGYQLA